MLNVSSRVGSDVWRRDDVPCFTKAPACRLITERARPKLREAARRVGSVRRNRQSAD